MPNVTQVSPKMIYNVSYKNIVRELVVSSCDWLVKPSSTRRGQPVPGASC